MCGRTQEELEETIEWEMNPDDVLALLEEYCDSVKDLDTDFNEDTDVLTVFYHTDEECYTMFVKFLGIFDGYQITCGYRRRTMPLCTGNIWIDMANIYRVIIEMATAILESRNYR